MSIIMLNICGIFWPLHKGELTYDGHEIKVFDFLTSKTTKQTADMNVPGNFSKGGHGSADYHLIDSFIAAVMVRFTHILF